VATASTSLAVIALSCVMAVGATAGNAENVVVIRLKSIQTAEVRRGNVLELSDRLLNTVPQFGRPVGATIGTDSATVRVTSSTKVTMTVTATLPDGTITVRGSLIGVGKLGLSLPVIGGTGAYAHARGTYWEPAHQSHGVALNIYRLTVP